MSGQSGGQRLRLSTLNEHLTCKVCGGYFVDATTIIECLHTFCKSCIVKHLENNKYCPACDAQVHKNKPLLNIRPDHIIQDIVYKLVPGCYQNEMRCRKEFYAKHPEERSKVTSPEAKGEPTETYIYSPDESLSLSLEYYSPEGSDENEDEKEAAKLLPRRYLRCPAAVTVSHLQKLIRAKYGLSEAHRVDIMYKEEPLSATYTLMDIMYIYHWKRKVPLHLSYRIFESATKRIKLSDDNDEFKQSLSNSNMELDSQGDEREVKREWKEVQLKISETGVMSVMDISSNSDTKKNVKASTNSDEVSSNSCNDNATNVKAEEKEPAKPSTGRGRRAQQDSLAKKNDKPQEDKASGVGSASAIRAFQNNAKNEEMEVKTIDQRDLSNELLRSAAAESGKNSAKIGTKESAQSTAADKSQKQQQQTSTDKVKTEPVSSGNASEKQRIDSKQQQLNSKSNNLIGGSEVKSEANAKQNAKISAGSAGSKINALSAKLQFQPKIGQVNNTYSKKSAVTTSAAASSDKKRALSPSTEKTNETKALKTLKNSEVKSSSTASVSQPSDSKVSVPVSNAASSIAHSQGAVVSTPSVYVTASSGTNVSSANSLAQQQQIKTTISQSLRPSSGGESPATTTSIGLHAPITASQVASLNSWITSGHKSMPNKAAIVDQQLRSLPGMPQIGKEIVCSTTAASSPPTNAGRLSIQTPSMSIYYSSPSKQQQQQQQAQSIGSTSMYPVPPCPDAIPISLMKSSSSSAAAAVAAAASARKDALTKGSTVNEICDKIRISSKLGVADSAVSKDKSRLEAQQRGKPEIPELLKISKKSEPASSVGVNKHIPNIPNVPIYTPSNSQLQQQQMQQLGLDTKDIGKRPIATIAPSSQSSILTALHHQQQQKQLAEAASKQAQSGASYKTLRYPPKNWNPTLSKNNYVAAKNQAKELQAYNAAAAAAADGTGVPRQIPSKPPKIFKNKNTPRFLGNPASGVKPMYGAVNEQLKEKEQSGGSKGNPVMSMTKIDPQTLSPIVSSHNAMVSPPPYSPTARSASGAGGGGSGNSYQNNPYQRNSSGASINSSPRNSPVNMLSTSPFIPSHTPNTNPRIIYFPPNAGYGSDANHPLSNPLIRPPIHPPPSAAFHCSLPPSINKLYQRSGYLAQPQTSVAAAFSSAVAAAAAAGFSPSQMQQGLQRLQLPSPNASSSPSLSAKSSPKTSLAPSSASIALATTSATASLVDSVALHLAAKREAQGIFESLKAQAANARQQQQQQQQLANPPPPVSSAARVTSPKQSGVTLQQKASSPSTGASEATAKKSDTGRSPNSKTESANASPTKEDSASAASVASATTDKKESGQAKVNGDVPAVTLQNSEKPKNEGTEAQTQGGKDKTESKSVADGSNDKKSTSPSKTATTTTTATTGGKSNATSEAQESTESGDKLANNSTNNNSNSTDQSKQENNKTCGSSPTLASNKANTEAQSEKKASES